MHFQRKELKLLPQNGLSATMEIGMNEFSVQNMIFWGDKLLPAVIRKKT
jgi:hypothetical protein